MSLDTPETPQPASGLTIEERYPLKDAYRAFFQAERPIIAADSSEAYRDQLAAHLRTRAAQANRNDALALIDEAQALTQQVRVGGDARPLGRLHRAEALLLNVTPFEMDRIIHTEQVQRALGVAPRVENDDYAGVFERRKGLAERLGRHAGERERAQQALAMFYTAGFEEHLAEPRRTLMVDRVARFAGGQLDTMVRLWWAQKTGKSADMAVLSDLFWDHDLAARAVAMAEFNRRAGLGAKLRKSLAESGEPGQVVLKAVSALSELRAKAPVLFSSK